MINLQFLLFIINSTTYHLQRKCHFTDLMSSEKLFVTNSLSSHAAAADKLFYPC
jgi:hypothetical protein